MNNTELILLFLFCKNRNIHTKFSPYISVIQNMERELKFLFNLINQYYEKYQQEQYISKDDLITFINISLPNLRNKKLYIELVNNAFESAPENEQLADEILDNLIEKYHAAQIVDKLLPVVNGDKSQVLHTLRTDVDEYISLLKYPPEGAVLPEPCELSVEELVELEIMDEGMPWHLNSLTKTIGGIRKQTLGLISAYVDTGKTSFTLSATANFGKYLNENETICYAGNEESSQRLKLRLIQTLVQKTKTEILQNIQEATEQAENLGLNKIKIFDQINTAEQIIQIINKYSPTILIIDQGTDVELKTTRTTEGVEYQKQLFKWYRKLATRFNCAVICVAQAVGEAEKRKWLNLSDIYGSRVAIQGALDYAILIGKTVGDPATENYRYITIPKNKLLDGDSIKFTVKFDKYRATFKEI